MLDFDTWKTNFLGAIWYEYLEWNPDKIEYYRKNSHLIPKCIPEPEIQFSIIEKHKSKYEIRKTLEDDLSSLSEDLRKVIKKHSNSSSQIFNETIASLEKVLESDIENYKNLYDRKFFKDSNPRDSRVPKSIVIHILRALIAFKGESEKFEDLRHFLFSDFPDWKRENNIGLSYSVYSVPQSKQDNTDWARNLKNRLINIIEPDKKKQKKALGYIKSSIEKFYS